MFLVYFQHCPFYLWFWIADYHNIMAVNFLGAKCSRFSRTDLQPIKYCAENFRIIIDMARHLPHLRKLFLGNFVNSKSSNNYMSL